MKKRYLCLFACLLLCIPLVQLAGQSSPGDVWVVPGTSTVQAGTSFPVEIFINTGNAKIAALGLDIDINPQILQYGTISQLIFEPLFQNIARVAIAPENPGRLTISGFSAAGVGPGTELKFATIDMRALTPGTSVLSVEVNTLTDANYASIGIPGGINGQVTVVDATSPGDPDGNGVWDIIDALKTAQYAAGLNPQGFNAAAADVNCDGTVNIIDALVIAQYVVGVISVFGC